jgi:alpha-glucosidase
MGEPWWKNAVVYQIYPRSFADASGDGVGDLEGIRSRLDHLSWLGVDAIWISPFFRSPMKDFGYDVADYCDVDPLFGSLEDFDRLLDDAHARGIKVMIDWVPNHSSDQHPWFVESRSSRDNAKADWYIWKDGTPDRPPNNWRCAFTNGPAWEWVPERQQWYLHLFLPEQPDLNWRHPEVVDAMHGTLRFWLDRGVDGFRIDVVHGLLKNPGFPDDTGDQSRTYDRSGRFDIDATIDLVRDFRTILDSYDGDRAMVGEVFLLSTAQVARFYGDGDALHMSFNFPPLFAPWEATAWRKRIDRVHEELDARNAWPTWVLSNHDQPRHRTRYGSEARARAAAVLLLTLRGTPFLYAGEELGLEDAQIPADRVVDPGGRDGCRAPVPWTADARHGWGLEDNWLPWPPQPELRNAASLRADETSIVHLYRRLLQARRASDALRLGAWSPIETAADGVLAYARTTTTTTDGSDASDASDRRVVVVNYTSEPRAIALEGQFTIEVASDDAELEGKPFGGALAPDQALLLT